MSIGRGEVDDRVLAVSVVEHAVSDGLRAAMVTEEVEGRSVDELIHELIRSVEVPLS